MAERKVHRLSVRFPPEAWEKLLWLRDNDPGYGSLNSEVIRAVVERYQRMLDARLSRPP